MFLKTGKSAKEIGFLSPEIEPVAAQCRKQNAIWFALAEDINRTAQATLAEYRFGREISAQHLFGLLLLIRTLSNFQGGLLMAERGMAVEARTLFRSCFESAFWLGALLRDGDNFINGIMGDEVASTKSKAKWLVSDLSRLELSGPNVAARLQARVGEMEKAWSKVSGQRLADAAKRGSLGDAYIYYKVLSGDAAHPSVSALDLCAASRQFDHWGQIWPLH